MELFCGKRWFIFKVMKYRLKVKMVGRACEMKREKNRQWLNANYIVSSLRFSAKVCFGILLNICCGLFVQRPKEKQTHPWNNASHTQFDASKLIFLTMNQLESELSRAFKRFQ